MLPKLWHSGSGRVKECCQDVGKILPWGSHKNDCDHKLWNIGMLPG